MNELRETLKNIGYGLKDDYKMSDVGPEPFRKVKTPITPDMYGPQEDYVFEDYGTGYVLHPVSEAALTWCSDNFHDSMPRFGTQGYILNAVEKQAVEIALKHRGMMSREDYVEAMEENEQVMRQGQ